MRATTFAFFVALNTSFLLHSSHATPHEDTPLDDLCTDVLERYSATAETSFREITERVQKNPTQTLESEIRVARVPLLKTLTDFFVHLLKSEGSSFHPRSAYALLQGNRFDLLQVLAADPDVPGQSAALGALGLRPERPLEDLYFQIVRNLAVKADARRAAVSALRSRLWKMDETAAERAVLDLLALLRQEKESLVAREIVVAVLFRGSATSPEVFSAIGDYCRDPESAFAPDMVWSLSVLAPVPAVRLLFLELSRARSQTLRETALTALGRSRGVEVAGELEARARTAPDPHERIVALRALSDLALYGDQASFEGLVKLFKEGKDDGSTLMKVVRGFSRTRPPEWLSSWSEANVSTWGALLHAWVDALDGGDRSIAMEAFEKVWDLLPARNSELTLFWDLGLVYDEEVHISSEWRSFGTLFGSSLPSNYSIRRVRKATPEQKTLFHQKINEYVEFLKRKLDANPNPP